MLPTKEEPRLTDIMVDARNTERQPLSKPLLEIESFTKCFGERTAASSISLKVGPQDRLAILGPSGAGKSTLLRLVAGLERPDSGQLRIDGSLATSLAPNRRGLAYMSQDYPLYPQLNVRRNLETALLPLKLSKQVRDSRCQETLNWFGIEDLAQRLPSQLSGGQAQRVALAKALIRRPRCLLLDEPLSQLDSALRDELHKLLMKVCDHFAGCLVFVTHNPLDAFELANRLAILIDGKLVQQGTPSEVYHSPSCRPAAELLSPWGINWLSSQSVDPSRSLSSIGPSKLLDRLRVELSQGMSVGFRPENCHLIPASSLGKPLADEEISGAEEHLVLPVVIERLQSVGFAQMVHARADRDGYRCLLPNTANVPDNLPSDLATDSLRLVIAASALLHCRTN